MGVLLVRVDSRLVHGQVIEGWVPYLGADTLVVADDLVAANPLQRAVMEMAAPMGVQVDVETVDELVRRAREEGWREGRAVVLFASVDQAARARRAGFDLTALNVGCVPHGPGRKRVTNAVFLNRHELEVLGAMSRDGLYVDFRAVPTETPPDAMALVANLLKAEG